MATKIKSDGRTITVRVPISIRKRGGRKVILTPDGASPIGPLRGSQRDDALVKAVARAFRWRAMLEDSKCATIKEIAMMERINSSYLSRVLRLTLLAPDIVEEILAGKHQTTVTLPKLTRRLPVMWRDQRTRIRGELAAVGP